MASVHPAEDYCSRNTLKKWPLVIGSLLLAPAVTIAFPDLKDSVIALVEFVAESVLLFVLGSRVIRSKTEAVRQNKDTLLWVSFAIAFIADCFYSARILKLMTATRDLDIFIELLYGSFSVSFALALVSRFATVDRPWRTWGASGAVVLVINFALSYIFIEIPYFKSDFPAILKANSMTYAVCSAITCSVVLPFASRHLHRNAYWFSQCVLFFLTGDFALRYQTSFVNVMTFSWAEFAWCSSFVGFAWIISLAKDNAILTSSETDLAPILSVRNLLTLVICGANALFLVGILSFRIYVPGNGSDFSAIAFLLLSFWLISNEFAWWLSADLSGLAPAMFNATQLRANASDSFKLQSVSTRSNVAEISQILESYNSLVGEANKLFLLSHEADRNAAVARIASQVSHDIRSPLTMLNFITAKLGQLPEETRVMIRQATQRINDIANDLLIPKGNQIVSNRGERVAAVLIGPLIDSIMSEKRIQYRSRNNIALTQKIDESYGLFSLVRISEFNRCMSNLIDNAVESLSGNEGLIEVVVVRRSEDIIITITDNGRGIPEEIKSQIGTRGFSFGKDGKGSGLGFHHALATVRSFGGDVVIASKVNVGSVVSVNLPVCEPPLSFAQFVEIQPQGFLISIDDDQTIHSIWSDRIAHELGSNVEHLQFQSITAFCDWMRVSAQNPANTYLVDFEFTESNENGFEAIAEIHDLSKTYLVTSRHDEARVVAECIKRGIKIIPKAFAGVVPFNTTDSESKDFDTSS